MKPTRTVPPDLLDNGRNFQSEFFKRFDLRRSDRPLVFEGGLAKQYLFPSLYDRVACALGAFPCSYRRAAEYLAEKLHPSIRPVSMLRGRALVIFACYAYREVMGIPPYNEIAVTIPVMVNAAYRPPILPVLFPGFERFGLHVLHMPVTSHENTVRGNRLWGLPKVTREIEMELGGTQVVTRVMEDDGTPYLTLNLPTTGKPKHFDVSAYLYSRLEGRIIRSRTCFTGTFQVQLHASRLLSKGGEPANPYLQLGDTPGAADLHFLEIEPNPLLCRFSNHMSSSFDLPDPRPPKWMDKLSSQR